MENASSTPRESQCGEEQRVTGRGSTGDRSAALAGPGQQGEMLDLYYNRQSLKNLEQKSNMIFIDRMSISPQNTYV